MIEVRDIFKIHNFMPQTKIGMIPIKIKFDLNQIAWHAFFINLLKLRKSDGVNINQNQTCLGLELLPL